MFVCSKTKVTPIKNALTIPRLELQGALILAALITRVSKELNINSDNVFLFSDSQIILGWLNKGPVKFVLFVANRIKLILDHFSYKC